MKKKRKQKSNTSFRFLLIVALFALGGATFYSSVESHNLLRSIKQNQAKKIYLATREEMHEIIDRLCMSGSRREVSAFFDGYTQDRLVTESILSASILNDVPVLLSFALVQRESQFNPRAIGNNGNSKDYGLWQLNSLTFRRVSEKEFFDPRTNSKLGAQYLRAKYDEHLRWEKAILSYNCGYLGNVPERSISYLCDVLDIEDRMNEAFIQKFL